VGLIVFMSREREFGEERIKKSFELMTAGTKQKEKVRWKNGLVN
jgi:hypothetical protein